MPEINKPATTTFFFFMDENIAHTGSTKSGQVTTSGLDTLIQNTDEAQFLTDITPHSRKLPTRPARDVDAVPDRVYDDGGVPKIIRRRG